MNTLTESIKKLPEGIFCLIRHPKKLCPKEQFEWEASMGLHKEYGNTAIESVENLCLAVIKK